MTEEAKDVAVPDELHKLELFTSDIDLLISHLSAGKGAKPTSTMALIGRLHTAKSRAVKPRAAKGTRKPRTPKAGATGGAKGKGKASGEAATSLN